MISMKRVSWTLAASAILLSTMAVPAFAQDDERDLGWAFEVDLGALWTGGNQETSTLAFGGTAAYVWPVSQLTFTTGGFTSESSLTTSTAYGTGQDDFQIVDVTTTEKTAETFLAALRYDYDVSAKFFLTGVGDWLRNPFAGIDDRFVFGAGVGNRWVDNGKVRFTTDYMVTYTTETNVVPDPTRESDFAGLRLGYDFLWDATSSTNLESTLIADFNLDNTADIRLDWYNGLPIDISSVLAFKPSIRLLWRNDPALQIVPLFDAPGGTETGAVFTPLNKLDTFFNLSLLFKF
jgi:putative salt-induced outer membrane protein YdiY